MDQKLVKEAIRRVNEDTNRYRERNGGSRLEILEWSFDDKDNTVTVSTNGEPSTRLYNAVGSLNFVNSDVDTWQDDELDGATHRLWHMRIKISRRRGDISKALERVFQRAIKGPISPVFIVEALLLVGLLAATLYFSSVVIYDIFLS